MDLKEKYKGALHDNPLTRLKAQEEERRRNSPRGTLLEKQSAELQALQRKIVSEGKELAHEHTVKRGKVAMLNRPEHRDFEPGLKREEAEMRAHHAKLLRAITDKHDTELKRFK